MKTRFQSLQESLRAGVWARLERGELTGKSLARKAGFRQAHLSNFLNGKRGLSLQAMDRLLDVLHLDVLHLAGLEDTARQAWKSEHHRSELVEDVAVVTLAAAARQAHFSAHDIRDTVSFRQSFLRRLKPHIVGNRRDWTRFVVVIADTENARAMAPLLRKGAQLLIDRHCNAPPRVGEPSPDIFAVLDGSDARITRITATPGHLILRPLLESDISRVRLLPIPAGHKPGDFIIGRVRHLAMEM